QHHMGVYAGAFAFGVDRDGARPAGGGGGGCPARPRCAPPRPVRPVALRAGSWGAPRAAPPQTAQVLARRRLPTGAAAGALLRTAHRGTVAALTLPEPLDQLMLAGADELLRRLGDLGPERFALQRHRAGAAGDLHQPFLRLLTQRRFEQALGAHVTAEQDHVRE